MDHPFLDAAGLELLENAKRYVKQHAATLAWHRLYNYPVLRDLRLRADVGLDGFRR